MICLDTNIIIYLVNGTLSQKALPADTIFVYASITKIEALGYSKLSVAEAHLIKKLFEEGAQQIELTPQIVETAIILRQLRNCSLGDSIVAATALELECSLWTANTKDFEYFDGLQIVNPLAK